MLLFSGLRFALVVLTLGLSGCGFQLQGALTFPPQMERTYIDAQDRFSAFFRTLRRDLLSAGIDVVDSADAATATIIISADLTGQRVLSVSARNVPTEFEVYYTVEYSVVSGKSTLVQTRDVTLTRDYTYDSTLVLGKAQEEAALREAVVSDLVSAVLKQISAR